MKSAAVFVACSAVGTVLGFGAVLWWMETGHRLKPRKRCAWE